MLESIQNFVSQTGIVELMSSSDWWKTLVMFIIAGVLVYLAIVKQYEPLLLLPIAIGMLLANLPGAGLFHMELFLGDTVKIQEVIDVVIHEGGLIDLLYLGVKLGLYPSIIFIGIGYVLPVFGRVCLFPISFSVGNKII